MGYDFIILLRTFLNGLFIGGIYAVIAIGLTLIYDVMFILNLANGEFLMLGIYVMLDMGYPERTATVTISE